MFGKRTFADMRRAGMSVGLSKAKLSKAMLEILIQFPDGTANLKETIVHHLGLLGQMSPTRDITAVWNETKKKAAREYPDRFVLGARGVLQWNDGSVWPSFDRLEQPVRAKDCEATEHVPRVGK